MLGKFEKIVNQVAYVSDPMLEICNNRSTIFAFEGLFSKHYTLNYIQHVMSLNVSFENND